MTFIKEDFWALNVLQNDDTGLPALQGTALGFVKRKFSVTPNSGGLKRLEVGVLLCQQLLHWYEILWIETELNLYAQYTAQYKNQRII